MTARQEAKLNMYHAVQLLCNNNTTLTATNTAFTNSFDSLEEKIAEIDAAVEDQSEIITGLTTDKSAAKINLSTLASDLAANIFAFASDNDNNALKEKVNYSESALSRERDDQLVPLCKIIVGQANTNLADLADYGVTTKSIKVVTDAMKVYSACIPANTNAVSGRKTTGTELRQSFKDVDKILKEKLDRLVKNFKSADKSFVSTFKNARNIIGPATKKKKKAEAASINISNSGNKEGKKDLQKVA